MVKFVPTSAPNGISAVSEVREGIMQFVADDEPVGRSLQLYGEWLHGVVAYLAKLIRLEQSLLEMDASIGAHGIALSRMLGRRGHLIAFESDAVRRRLLAQNFSYNKIQNATILTLPSRVAGACDEIDYVCDLDAVGMPDLDWIKFNAEGSMLAVIEASQAYMWRVRPRVLGLFEDEAAARRAAGAMDQLGFRNWLLQVPLFNTQNFNNNSVNVFGTCHSSLLISIPETILIDTNLDPAIEI
jgi:hypothetical protein